MESSSSGTVVGSPDASTASVAGAAASIAGAAESIAGAAATTAGATAGLMTSTPVSTDAVTTGNGGMSASPKPADTPLSAASLSSSPSSLLPSSVAADAGPSPITPDSAQSSPSPACNGSNLLSTTANVNVSEGRGIISSEVSPPISTAIRTKSDIEVPVESVANDYGTVSAAVSESAEGVKSATLSVDDHSAEISLSPRAVLASTNIPSGDSIGGSINSMSGAVGDDTTNSDAPTPSAVLTIAGADADAAVSGDISIPSGLSTAPASECTYPADSINPQIRHDIDRDDANVSVPVKRQRIDVSGNPNIDAVTATSTVGEAAISDTTEAATKNIAELLVGAPWSATTVESAATAETAVTPASTCSVAETAATPKSRGAATAAAVAKPVATSVTRETAAATVAVTSVPTSSRVSSSASSLSSQRSSSSTKPSTASTAVNNKTSKDSPSGDDEFSTEIHGMLTRQPWESDVQALRRQEFLKKIMEKQTQEGGKITISELKLLSSLFFNITYLRCTYTQELQTLIEKYDPELSERHQKNLANQKKRRMKRLQEHYDQQESQW